MDINVLFNNALVPGSYCLENVSLYTGHQLVFLYDGIVERNKLNKPLETV